MAGLENINYSLDIIKREISEEFWEAIKSAVLYWTANSDDHNKGSDFDILLWFEEINIEILKSIKIVKKRCQNLWIKVDFNSHSDLELPKKSKKDFWHNNRWALFHAEVSKIWNVLIWNNPYKENFPKQDAIKEDVVRTLSSIAYRIRKVYCNTDLNEEERYILIKWAIYSASSALSYKWKFIKNKREIATEFEKEYPNLWGIEKYLPYKMNRDLKIPDKIIDEILEFTEKLSEYFRKTHK